MSFNWSHFLVVAEVLAQGAEDSPYNEATYRIAISRAYYAAFCTVRNYLRDKGELLPSGRGDDHNQVIDWLKKSSDKQRQKLGILLRNLRIARNSADYEDEFYDDDLSSIASDAVKIAKQIIKYVSDNQK